MSTNCFITKLKSVVNNDNLLKVGEIKFTRKRNYSTTTGADGVVLTFNEPVELKLDTGVFVNNNQDTLVVPANTKTTVQFQYDSIMSLTNKYALTEIEWGQGYGLIEALDFAIFNNSPLTKMNIRDGFRGYSFNGMQYGDYSNLQSLILISVSSVQGKISNIQNANSIESINIENTQLNDSKIEDFSGLTSILQLRIINTGITGSINSLSTLSNLNSLRITDPISGDVSFVYNLSSLTAFQLNGTSVGGNINAFNNCPNLKDIYIEGSGSFTGDVATVNYLQNAAIRTIRNFTWSSRDTSKKIVCGVFGSISNLEAMIINESQCVAPDLTGVKIDVTGILDTSSVASELAALRNKGVAVVLNGTIIN